MSVDIRHYWTQARLDGRWDVVSFAVQEPGKPPPDPPEVLIRGGFSSEDAALLYISEVQRHQRAMQTPNPSPDTGAAPSVPSAGTQGA